MAIIICSFNFSQATQLQSFHQEERCNLQFEISSSIPSVLSDLNLDENWKGRLIVLWSGLGEYAWAKRLENACKNLGWHCITSIDPAEFSEYDKLVQDKPSTPEEIVSLIQQHEPDCIISLKWDRIYEEKIPHYLSATGVLSNLYNPNSTQSSSLFAYAGILTAFPDIKSLNNFFTNNNKKLNSMLWWPSCTATQYHPVNPRSIFCCGFQWDGKRNGFEYRQMFSLLDAKGYLDVYGPADKWLCAPNSVRGMTFDEEEFRMAMRKSGIVLVLHSQTLLDLNTPSGRIFEAAAASCVIICDKNPFVMKEFGDSVLYIDHSLSGEAIFHQIDAHRKWILEHPKEAELMAKKAHTIFLEKFALEKQLIDFKRFHLRTMEESRQSLNGQ